MFRWVLCLTGFVILACICAQAQQDPLLTGYVTRAGSPEDFDVNGQHVTCTPTQDNGSRGPQVVCSQHAFGQHLALYGSRNRKLGRIVASKVESAKQNTGQSASGEAVIDAVLGPDLLRADGRAIRLQPSTKVDRAPALPASSPQAGDWIRYSGKYTADGVVATEFVALDPPTVSKSEQKLRGKYEFDPAAVTDEDRQSGLSRAFRGRDLKRIPATQDAALQGRVEKLAQRLIPTPQKQLAADDPNKIGFRFQVVESKWADAYTLPNGIILIPEPIVRELNDDQLAAVLADNIATALEKQTYRSLPAGRAMTATNLAGAAGGLLIPGLGIATSLGTYAAGKNMLRHAEEQSGRMSLVLLHDAGFDIQQAPMAWWRIAARNDEFMQTKVPGRAAYLFGVLANEWAPGDALANAKAVDAPSTP